jgi:2-polyprenyl-3-methyl-5-hydroxy-6-metoxy-1,4-benzoquinol methylase
MSGPIDYTCVSGTGEVGQILDLQAANLASVLTPGTIASQGFLTVRHDPDVLLRMNEAAPAIIAKDGDRVVGYALVMPRRFASDVPILQPLFQLLEGLSWKDVALRDSPRWFVMGQVCIAAGYRGQGIFDGLYRTMASVYRDRFDFTVTEVAARNTRSLRAHARVGFETLQHHTDDSTGERWHVIALDLARPAQAGRRYDSTYWEALWERTLREHPGKVARRPPNAHLVSAVAGLPPGRALDAGCGHGAEALWLAAHGWHVTAVDVSASALAYARSTAEALSSEIAGRTAWVEGDLASWTPPREQFDLVVCLYVHVAGAVGDMVRRLAGGVAAGGSLFLVGHRPIDPVTGQATAAAGQVQISIEGTLAALAADAWEIVVADERPRAAAGSGVDAVILARRVR